MAWGPGGPSSVSWSPRTTSPALTLATSILPSLIGGGLGFLGASRQNRANRTEAERAREFTREMSNTAHQRQVQDMRAAGLNPILSATGGQGASTPAAAMARMENEIQPAISTAKLAARFNQEMENMKNLSYKDAAAGWRDHKMVSVLNKEILLKDQQEKTEVMRTQREKEAAMGQWLDNQLMKFHLVGAGIDAEIDASARGRLYREVNKAKSALPSFGFGFLLGAGKGKGRVGAPTKFKSDPNRWSGGKAYDRYSIYDRK